jgi:hypothetical protein
VGFCAALPAGIVDTAPILFNRTCVGSNLNLKMRFALVKLGSGSPPCFLHAPKDSVTKHRTTNVYFLEILENKNVMEKLNLLCHV